MALPLANNAEGGSNGTTVSNANSGGTSGNAWDLISVVTGGVCQFSNTSPAHGSLCYAFSTGATAGSSLIGWTTSVGTTTTLYGRAYYKITGTSPNTDAI